MAPSCSPSLSALTCVCVCSVTCAFQAPASPLWGLLMLLHSLLTTLHASVHSYTYLLTIYILLDQWIETFLFDHFHIPKAPHAQCFLLIIKNKSEQKTNKAPWDNKLVCNPKTAAPFPSFCHHDSIFLLTLPCSVPEKQLSSWTRRPIQ